MTRQTKRQWRWTRAGLVGQQAGSGVVRTLAFNTGEQLWIIGRGWPGMVQWAGTSIDAGRSRCE